MTMISIRNAGRRLRAPLLAAACALIGLFPGGASAAPGTCGNTNQQLLQACRLGARDEAGVGSAICLNLSNSQASRACMRATQEALSEALAECQDVRKARDEVCEAVGPGPYDPVIDPANFVSGIDNPYSPFPPGAFREYEKRTAEGLERVRVEVLAERRQILGVEVTTLRDTVTLDGVLIEDTIDWLVQDVDGNVWYFGEISQNFQEGLLANLDGSFEAGKNGAKPGFWIKAAPQVGESYRQEWSLGVAEDVVEVVSLDATDTNVPFSGSGPVLKTRDFTPLSPGVEEFKYFVPGIGFALEVDPETGERLELVDYGPR